MKKNKKKIKKNKFDIKMLKFRRNQNIRFNIYYFLIDYKKQATIFKKIILNYNCNKLPY
jgi:hypothetical protein